MQEELNTVANLTLLQGSVADLFIGAPESNIDTSGVQYGQMQGIALGTPAADDVANKLRKRRDRSCFSSYYYHGDILGGRDTYW
jgi:hypothetical protein